MKKLYMCPKCKAVFEELVPCDCEPGCVKCCGESLREVTANTVEAAHEKHIPVVTGGANGTHVAVGAVPHPMTPEHYIVWIEILNGAYVNRFYLKPGEAPEAAFHVPLQKGMVVRAYCNLHGLWEAVVK